MKYKIISASLNELDELASISRQTFIETFGWYNSDENMHLYLHNDMGSGSLKAELENKDVSFFLLKEGDKIGGYMKVNYNSSHPELEDDTVIEIERIYLLKSHLRKGLGKMLLEKAIQLARESHCNYIWLAVWELNTDAIEFYKSQGFQTFGSKKFRLGNDVQDDICMRLAIA